MHNSVIRTMSFCTVVPSGKSRNVSAVIRVCLMGSQAGHCSSQWLTSSTSPLWHSVHILLSLSTSLHLPNSILNAAVPPHNFINIELSLFFFTTAHLDSSFRSPIFLSILSLGLSAMSLFITDVTFLHAELTNISQIFESDRLPTASTSI